MVHHDKWCKVIDETVMSAVVKVNHLLIYRLGCVLDFGDLCISVYIRSL